MGSEKNGPVAMVLYSLAVLKFAGEGCRYYEAPLRPRYHSKSRASLADKLAPLRRENSREQVLSLALSGRHSKKFINTLLNAGQRAA